MQEIRIAEDRINVARTDYNDIIRTFNIGVVTFPRNIIANMFGVKEQGYFEIDKGKDKTPEIKL